MKDFYFRRLTNFFVKEYCTNKLMCCKYINVLYSFFIDNGYEVRNKQFLTFTPAKRLRLVRIQTRVRAAYWIVQVNGITPYIKQAYRIHNNYNTVFILLNPFSDKQKPQRHTGIRTDGRTVIKASCQVPTCLPSRGVAAIGMRSNYRFPINKPNRRQDRKQFHKLKMFISKPFIHELKVAGCFKF